MNDTHSGVKPPYRKRGGVATIAVALVAALPMIALAPVAKSSDAADSTRIRFFVSGHSLTDNPYANYIAAVLTSKKYTVDWNQQIVIGSPTKVRTMGMDDQGKWGGYSKGKDRHGRSDVRVLEEFAPAAPKPYTHLILTEGNELLLNLINNDTLRFTRHFHEKLVAHNGAGQTLIFQPWEIVKDSAKPQDWIALEKSASRVWACLANRINLSIEREGRQDRVGVLPAGHALADLLEAAMNKQIAPWSNLTAPQLVKRLFSDNVHITGIGKYYLALVSAAVMTKKDPSGAWAPSFLDKEIASALQNRAWEFVQKNVLGKPLPAMAQCRAHMANMFCKQWNDYAAEYLVRIGQCKSMYSKEVFVNNYNEGPNPFLLPTKEQDASYWFAPN